MGDCVGCGYCCKKAPCAIAVELFRLRPQDHCPALVHHDGRYWCSLVENAKPEDQKRIKEDMAIGAGCSSSLLNTVRDDQVKKMEGRAKLLEAIQKTLSDIDEMDQDESTDHMRQKFTSWRQQIEDEKVTDPGFKAFLLGLNDYWGPKDRAYAAFCEKLAETCEDASS